MSRIHDEAAFEDDAIVANAGKFGFSDTLAVRLFLWELEIAAQIHMTTEKAILKGGAATQLFLPIGTQRGSVDVDMVTDLQPDLIEEMLATTQSRMGKLKFEPYVPAKPRVLSRLKTYSAYPDPDQKDLFIKVDFMLHDLNLPTVELERVPTFAVLSAKVKCYSAEVLLGDKMLTLANGSIGLTNAADYPKQIYDISMLLSARKYANFGQTVQAIQGLTPIEAEMVNVKTDAMSALRDVVSFTDRVLVPIDTRMGDPEMKNKIENFENLFVPSGQRVPLYEWSSRALRIRFAANLAMAALNSQIEVERCPVLLDKALEIASALSKVRGDKARKSRNALLSLEHPRLPYEKELRGKPLERVYWQIMTPSNMDEIGSFV